MSETAVLPETEPAPPLLVESLASLDRDYSGESQFARLAVSSLRAFLARHESDHAVSSAYNAAIRTLEVLPGVLSAAQDRAAGTITHKILMSEAERLSASEAAAEREYAIQWAASAPPLPVVEPPPPPPQPEEGI